MTPQDAKAIATYIAGLYSMEVPTTARVLAAIPADKLDYSPDDKSMKSLDLAKHIAGGDIMILDIVSNGGDAPFPAAVNELGSPAEVVAWYETEVAAALARVAALSDEQLAKVVSVWGGAFTMPAVNFMGFALNHTIHHRGQLSAYLRPMGAKVPSIYGPSGDSAS